MVVNKNGHFYVCGDVSMAEDVYNSLQVGLLRQTETVGQQTKSK